MISQLTDRPRSAFLEPLYELSQFQRLRGTVRESPWTVSPATHTSPTSTTWHPMTCNSWRLIPGREIVGPQGHRTVPGHVPFTGHSSWLSDPGNIRGTHIGDVIGSDTAVLMVVHEVGQGLFDEFPQRKA